MLNTLKKLIIGIGLIMAINVQALPIVIDLGTTTGQPAGISNEFQRLLDLVDDYNLNNTDLSTPVESLGVTYDINNGPKSIDVSFQNPFTGFLMFKWGNKDQFYYVEDLLDYSFTSTIPNQNNQSYLGLSHWNHWGTEDVSVVPEGGSSLAILGLGLTVLTIYGKKYRNGLTPA